MHSKSNQKDSKKDKKFNNDTKKFKMSIEKYDSIENTQIWF